MNLFRLSQKFGRLAVLLVSASLIVTAGEGVASGVGDVEIHLNGGADVAYIGQSNTVEFWIQNDAPLSQLVLGFEFGILAAYSFDATHGTLGYFNPEGDAVGSFDLAHNESSAIDDISRDSIQVLGQANGASDQLPAHNAHLLCYTMQVFIFPDQSEVTDGFCIDNILFSGSSAWLFDDGAPYPPDFQGNGNTSVVNPDAPPVCFDIVHPPATQPPVIVNCDADTLWSYHCEPFTHQFEAYDPDGSWTFTWSASQGTMAPGTGIFSLEYAGSEYENVFVAVIDDDNEVSSCEFTVAFIDRPPILYGPCDQSFFVAPEVPFTAQFSATDRDPCDDLGFFIGAVVPVPDGPLTIDVPTGQIDFTPSLADAGTDFVVDVAVTDQVDIEICQMTLTAGTEPIAVCGDANTDGLTNITDAVFLITYIFGGGDAPVPQSFGDSNCDGIVNITDAVYLISYIFAEGSPPGDPDNDGIPECVCDANPCMVWIHGPCCICSDCDTLFTATANPPGGTFSWEIVAGGDHAEITGSATGSPITVSGTSTSDAAEDVTLRVKYVVDGDTCEDEKQITIVSFNLTFRDTGTYSPDNGVYVAGLATHGAPQLGPVTPGSPAGCTDYAKGVEIRAEVIPCAPNCVDAFGDCEPDIKRLRRGRLGVKAPGGGPFIADGADSPGMWVDDDPDNDDEYLSPDGPSCSIYAVDAPGFPLPPCGAAQAGWTVVNVQNFKEWVEINGKVCSDTLYWHAATVISCDGTNNVIDSLCDSNNDCIRNEVGLGHVAWPDVDSTSKKTGANENEITFGVLPKLEVDFLLAEIGSDDLAHRLTGEALTVDLIRSGRFSAAELAELRRGLEGLRPVSDEQPTRDSAADLARRVLTLLDRMTLAE